MPSSEQVIYKDAVRLRVATASHGSVLNVGPVRPTRGILTIAFGAPAYIEMAKSLARSLIVHAPEFPRAVVTNSKDPDLDKLFTHKVLYRSEYGTNLRQKMYLDRYSPFDETLFLDSDCLVVRNLDSLWRAFLSVPFGACGYHIMRWGEVNEFLDVDFMLNRFGLAGLPKFNGGAYYFDRSPDAQALFATARDLLSRATELKFADFRGDGPNDEALYSVAMAIHNLTVIDVPGGGMWTPIDKTGPITVDIPKGICTFRKRGRVVTPEVIHFAMFTESLPYLRECMKLRHLEHGTDDISTVQELLLRVTVIRLWLLRKFKGLRRRLQRLAQRKP